MKQKQTRHQENSGENTTYTRLQQVLYLRLPGIQMGFLYKKRHIAAAYSSFLRNSNIVGEYENHICHDER